MNNKYSNLRQRTKDFAVAVLELMEGLPRGAELGVIKRQLIRCSTSVGANYRAAQRARSRKEFVARLLVEEEADECIYWLELLCVRRSSSKSRIQLLQGEASELVAIFVASRRTAIQNDSRSE